MYNRKLISDTADHIIEDVNEYIDNTIAWQFDETEIEGDDLYELELKIKQQLLFSLIKKVTK